MKPSLLLLSLGILVLGLHPNAIHAQTTITQRVVPNANGQTPVPPMARVPLPAHVAVQPSPILPANPDEMRRRIAAAVEDILALYGNPPFAEVITNDQVRAAALRAQLALVAQAESLRTEIAGLAETRDGLANQVAAKERELAYFRDQAATLQQTLAASLDRLSHAQANPALPAVPVSGAPLAAETGGAKAK